MPTYEAAISFLGLTLPLDELQQELGAPLEFLTRERIEDIIPDRSPFLIIEKAVIFEKPGGELAILTLTTVTERPFCDGHIPGMPMIPLITLSWVMALTGRLLATYHEKKPGVVGEVDHADRVDSEVDFSTLHFLKPPRQILCMGVLAGTQVIEKKGRNYPVKVIPAVAFSVGKDRMVSVGTINPLYYLMVPIPVLKRGLERKE